MGYDINEVLDELEARGFKHKKDYLFVDAGLYRMCGGPGPFKVDLGVSWLAGRYEDGGVYVRFVRSAPGLPKKAHKMGAIPAPASKSPEPPIGDDEPLPTIH